MAPNDQHMTSIAGNPVHMDKQYKPTKMAVVGLGCRFPGQSNSPQEFFDNLLQGKDCVQKVPSDRWNTDFYIDGKDKQRPGKVMSDQGGFMDHFFDFDHEAFAMSGKEACHIDVQQKILLEVCHQVLEDSNLQYRGSRTGVFIGTGQIDHGKMATSNPYFVNEYTASGSALSIHSNRLSYVFDLRGPSLSIDTACSSSGTAMHFACQSIESGQCENAVVGGINMLLNHSMSIAFSKLGVLSPDGRCKSFDAAANGYVRSEGCGLVVIKKLDAALRDGDHIYAVINSTAANQDGAQSPSLTMPSTEGQASVMQDALQRGHINVNDVAYVEAHATGTLVGDPIEINTIGRTIGGKGRTQPLRIGSVKSNIGHTECASYIASLIKCCLMMDRGVLVPSINFKNPNPKIHFDKYGLQVQQQVEEFDPRGKHIVISSFGFGGSNVCTVLEGPPARTRSQEGKWRLPLDKNMFLVSARTKQALQSRLEQFVAISDQYDQHQLAYSLNSAYHADSKYLSFGLGEKFSETKFGEATRMSDTKRPLCFVFSGQGPQSFDMGRELYKTFPSFRDTINRCSSLYKEASGIDILNDIGLFGDYRGADEKMVHKIHITLPALIMIQIGLFEMWKSMGVVPDVIVGHSFGEMCAMYASGACTLEQIIDITAARASMMTSLDNQGTMIAMGCGPQQANEMIQKLKLEKIWIAAYNSPVSVTLGGTVESVTKIAQLCDELKVFNRVLNVTNAYHTPLLSPLKESANKTFRSSVEMTDEPSTLVISTVTGKAWTGPFPASYFWDNIEGAVKFEESVAEVVRLFGEDTVFFEMAPHPVLSMSLKQCNVKNALYSLHRKEVDTESILRACANLYTHGHQVNWDVVMGENERIGYLPVYPFQRKQCFFENEFHREERLATNFKPFLGHSVIHADSTWQNYVNTMAYPWLEDHVVQEATIFPAAGYIEMALEALGTSLHDVVIHRAMTVPSDSSLSTMQTVIREDNQRVEIFSKAENGKSWSKHASAKEGVPLTKAITIETLEKLKERCTQSLDHVNVYRRFEVMNLFYGPAFRCIDSLWQGDEESVGLLSSTHLNDVSDYIIHPAVLDCSFQCFLGALKSSANTFLPTRLNRIHILQPNATPEKLMVYCNITDTNDHIIVGDIIAMDAANPERVIFVIEGFECTKVATAKGANALYTTVWQCTELPEQTFAFNEEIESISSLDKTWKNGVVPRISQLDRALAHYISQALPLCGELLNHETELPVDKQRYFKWCRDMVNANPDASESDLQVLDDLASNGFDLESQLIRRVGENLSALLLNKKNEVSNIMFGDDLMSQIYNHAITFRSSLNIMTNLFEQIDLCDSRVIRILEVGSGTGAMTHDILPILHAKFNKRIEYFFTDVSTAFIAQDKTAKQYPFVQYKAIDIDKPLAEQGISDGSVDILTGFDVVHTASNLKDTLRNLSSCLTPNGLLMLIEPTNVYNYMHFIFGVFREWWGFTDDREICCLQPNQWVNILPDIGFTNVQSIGFSDHVHSVIIARNKKSAIISTESTEGTVSEVQIFDKSNPQEFLSFVQKKIAKNDTTPLIVATVDAQMDYKSNEYSTIIGMARVFANENADTIVRMVDFSSSTSEQERGEILRCIQQDLGLFELEFAVRDGKVFVPRIIETHGNDANDIEEKPLVKGKEPFRLEADQPGLLDSLCYRRFVMPNPLPENHVVVRVKAAPLNFKDVMLAMNMLQIPDQYLGLEFAGVIEQSSSDGAKFAVGTPVFGFARHCLGSHVIAHQEMIVEKPSNLSFVEAASIPAVFVTSYVALVKKANMRKNDNVLVHSAAGGVGQASIQITKWKQGKVFATVGSDEKRKFLHDKYGVENFANSHSVDWDEEVRSLTEKRRGVDIILNSLSGDNIERGLRVLAPFGQFCEIGKRDIVENTPVGLSNFLQNVSYYSVHLDLMTNQRPDLVGELLQEVATLFEQKVFTPIVDRVYNASEILPAFRYMQQGSHLGKIVIDFEEKSPEGINIFPVSRIFFPQDTYVLVGGVGAVGFEIARWMVESEGARNVVLTSRSAHLEKYHRREIERLEREKGARIFVTKMDVLNASDVEQLHQKIAKENLPAVRGIINLAMVLDDDMIQKITPERLDRVLKPKVEGSMNIMKDMSPEELRFVVFFSSISSVIGNPEQINYAGGNAFLDGYAQSLSNAGHHARVINLGAVDDVGVIATDFRLRKLMFARGLGTTMTAKQVCETVKRAIQSDTVQHMCMLNFSQICQETPAVAPKMRHLITYDHMDEDEVDDDDSVDRINILVNKIASLLLIDPTGIDHDEKLTQYGVDSLLAVEISSLIAKIIKVKVSQMEILTGLTITQLKEKM